MAFTPFRIPRHLDLPPPAAPEGKAVTLASDVATPPLFYAPQLFWTDTGAPIDAAKVLRGVRAYMAAPIAFACIYLRAIKFREPPLMVVQETEDGESWLPKHKQAGILARPNPDLGMRRLLEATSILLDTTGACVWVKNRDNANRIASFYPFGQEEFRVEAGYSERARAVRLFGKYWVTTMGGEREFAPEDVVHFFNWKPGDPWHGLAPLDVALRFLGIGGQLAETLRASLRNFALPGGLYSVPEILGDEEFARLLSQVRTQYRDAKAGAPMLLEGGAQWQSTSSPLKDMALGEIYREVEATVCQCFQTPPVMAGAIIGIENSPWSNIEQATRNFYDTAVEPRWQDAEEVLEDQVLRVEGDMDPSHHIRFDRSKVRGIQDDQEKRGREANLSRETWTLNERRIHTGQSPLPDTDPRGQMIVGVDVAKQPANPTIPAKGRTMEAGVLGKRATAYVGGVECVWLDGVWRPVGEVKAAAERTAAIAIMDAVESAHASGIASACATLFKADRREVLKLARRMVKPGGKAQGDVPADPDTLDAAASAVKEYLTSRADDYLAALGDLLSAAAQDAGKRLADALSVDFDVIQPGVSAFADAERGWLPKVLTSATTDAVVHELQAARTNGLTPDALFARLEDLPEFDGARAELVGRTETTRITNGAGLQGMSQLQKDGGGTVTKTWLTAGDARVRAAHRALNGEKRGVDAPFSNGLQHPGEPNCRCTLTYSIEDAG